MKKRYRHLTEKYKTFRLQPDASYASRLVQTFYNKFTKKGKKALARRHTAKGIEQVRRRYTGPCAEHLVIRSLRNLRCQFILLDVRNGSTVEQVPVPVRRNKRDVMSRQLRSNAVRVRRERTFPERIEQELTALYYKKSSSAALKLRNTIFAKVYEERVLRDKRWR